jgi:hypothetical protein
MLRWYPARWRARYGDEFTELLIAEFDEQPRSWRRAADVARGGLLARLTCAGLTSHALEPAEQIRAGLSTAACGLATCLALGIAMWAQLAIGWAWAAPGTPGPTVAMVAMSASMLLFAVFTLLAALPLAWAAARGALRRKGWGVRRPALLVAAGLVTLVVGSRHFENGWPGTGSHSWAQPGLAPAGVAAFSWAATLSVSAYWAHPAALAAFPVEEITWMAVSPAALIAAIAGVAGLVRRLDLSARALRYEAWLAGGAAGTMTIFLAGACWWVLAGASGPGLFRPGAIDAASVAVMMLALWMARRAMSQARKSALSSRLL